jgi:YHS domain-containing protein
MRLRNLAMIVVMGAFAFAQDTKKGAVKDVEDPVCGMTVNPTTAVKSDFKGKTYYFCSLDDKKSFDESPAKYIKLEKKDTTKKQ